MADAPDSNTPEIWKPVPGYEGLYEVSSLGRVRSLDRLSVYNSARGPRSRLRKGKIRRPQKAGRYLMVSLRAPGHESKGRTIHSLVCEAFHGPRPEGMQVSHLNGSGTDNRAENLKWETPKANTGRQVGHGTAPKGERHPAAVLNKDGAAAIRKLGEAGMPRKQIARAFGVSEACVGDVLLGRSWKEVR